MLLIIIYVIIIIFVWSMFNSIKIELKKINENLERLLNILNKNDN